MNALITHLENGDDLAPREIDVAANLLLDPAVDDTKKEALLLALAKKASHPPKSPASSRPSSNMRSTP